MNIIPLSERAGKSLVADYIDQLMIAYATQPVVRELEVDESDLPACQFFFE